MWLSPFHDFFFHVFSPFGNYIHCGYSQSLYLTPVKSGTETVKKHLITFICCLGNSTVENENHCDFVKLREMLIRTNMEDLREVTHSKHYELYRHHKLEEMGFSDSETKRYVLEVCLSRVCYHEFPLDYFTNKTITY